MAKITHRKQLPTWYNENRYLTIKKADDKFIFDELFTRFVVWEELKASNNQVEDPSKMDELFSELKTFDNNAVLIDENDFNVHPIAAMDIVRISEVIKGNPELESAYLHEILNHRTTAYDGKGFCAGISLSLATDNEIIEEMRRLLPEMRRKLNIDPPMRYRMNEKHANLFSCGVFEYLDLTMWARAYGHQISNAFLALVIKPGTFTAAQIRGKVKQNAEHVMDFQFFEQYSADLKNRKIPNITKKSK